MTATPAVRTSSPTSSRYACPPPNSRGNFSFIPALMRSNVSSKRVRVSLSMRRMACSSVSSAEVRSANCRSRRGVHGLAGLVHELLGGEPLLVERAQLGIRILQRAPRYGELGLHLEPSRQILVAARLELHDRLITPGELLLQLVAAPCQLLALLDHPVAAHGYRALRGASRFDTDEQIACGALRLVRACPRRCGGFAPLLLL